MTPALDLIATHIRGVSNIGGWLIWIRDLGSRDYSTSCSVEEAVLVRQVERQVHRVLDENRVALSLLLRHRRWALAWEAWSRHPEEGAWESGNLVGFQTVWSIELLVRYKRILERIYGIHKFAVDAEIQRIKRSAL